MLEDALAGTDLADYARRHNFGLYVVRGAMRWPWANFQHRCVRKILEEMPVLPDGDKGRLFKAEQISDQSILNSLTKWLHTFSDMSLEMPSKHVQTQLHSLREDAHSSWPCRRQPAWMRSTEVVSLHLGSPGILCYQPRYPIAASQDSGHVSHRQALSHLFFCLKWVGPGSG